MCHSVIKCVWVCLDRRLHRHGPELIAFDTPSQFFAGCGPSSEGLPLEVLQKGSP